MFKYQFEMEDGTPIYITTNSLFNPNSVRWIQDDEGVYINLDYVRKIDLISRPNRGAIK